MKEQAIDLGKLEKADFKIEKDAYNPKAVICPSCGKSIDKSNIEIEVGNQIYMRISGFYCPVCKKNYLGIEETAKLDKALKISRSFSKGFAMERSLSFDGDNYTFRVPKEFTRKVKRKKIEIIPLGNDQFCGTIE